MQVSLNIKKHYDFLQKFPAGSYLQSRFWADVLNLQNIKTWQLNVYDQNDVIAHCLLYSNRLPLGKSYLYAPKGPLINATDPHQIQEAYALILSQIRDITIATEERQEIFCRLEPSIAPQDLAIPWTNSEPVEPKLTLLLDLKKSPEQLLFECKEKTRYNIRLAERKGLQIYWDDGELGLEKFLQVLPKTNLRQRISSHQFNHYRAIVEAGKKHHTVRIAWAEWDKHVLAANIYVYFNQTVTYLHGAFDDQYRTLMAPYLLHWQAIKEAHELGLSYYDFRGLAPHDNSKPSWEGFSRFKRGFGGQEIDSPGTYDFIYLPFWYNIYTVLRQTNRQARKLLR